MNGPGTITVPGLFAMSKKGLPFLNSRTRSKKRQTKALISILGH